MATVFESGTRSSISLLLNMAKFQKISGFKDAAKMLVFEHKQSLLKSIHFFFKISIKFKDQTFGSIIVVNMIRSH